MHILTILGFILGAVNLVISRYTNKVKIPEWLTMVLYLAAAVMIVGGMLISKNAAPAA